MPTDSPEASGPRKRKLSTKVITNGDPEVERKRKKLETKKQSTKQASTQKLKKAAMKPAPRPQRPSIEVEEVEDESDYHTSVPPHNPKNILEAADGSDDDVVITAPPKKSTKNSVPVITKQRPSVEVEDIFDSDDDKAADGSDGDMEDPVPNGNKDGEASEVSDEAELGT
jgi:hypothetical protein